MPGIATTTRRPAHCSKHAYAPSAPSRPRNGLTGDVTLPAQRHQTCLGRAGLASESPVAGDDPVNDGDPSGLISAGAICSEYGPHSSQCSGAEQVSAQVTRSENANQVGANKPIIDIAGPVGVFLKHNFGTIAQIAAGGACIVVTVGTCVVLIAGATVFKLVQLGVNGQLTADNAVGTVALGGAEVATAGIGGIFEYLGGGAGDEFENSLTYLLSTKGLAALSAIPFWIGDVSDLNLGRVSCPG